MENQEISVDVGSLHPYEVMHFRGGSGDITCAFTSWSPPRQDSAFIKKFNKIKTEVWLDLNVLSSADDNCIHENIKKLAKWAKENNLTISLKMAIFEKYRTNKKNPINYILKSARNLGEKYENPIDETELARQCRKIARYAASSRDFETLNLSVIAVRKIFHSQGSYQEKITKLAKCMSDFLVPSTTMLLISSLLFYLDESLEESSPLRKKLRRDMKVTGDPVEDKKNSENIASDIGLFTYSSWPQFDFDNNVFPIIAIATADRTLALLLKEMCHFRIDFKDGKNFQTPAYRPGSDAEEKLSSLVKSLSRKFLEINNESKMQRIDNARRVAELILKGENPLDI